MMTMLISLYGGLRTILGFITPRIVKYFLRRRSNASNNTQTNKTNPTDKPGEYEKKFQVQFNRK